MRSHVFFDLDGTLTDPKPGITRCIAYALEQLGRPCSSLDDLAWCIGPPLRGSLGRLLDSEDPELIESALSLYRVRFAEVGLFENAVYDGIPEALTELRESGASLHVATSKPQVYAFRILEHFELAAFFSTIVGSELSGRREDKAEVIEDVLLLSGAIPAESLMVGDRIQDVRGAAHHGIPCIGVTYGYGDESELAEAVALCRHPRDLPKLVMTS